MNPEFAAVVAEMRAVKRHEGVQHDVINRWADLLESIAGDSCGLSQPEGEAVGYVTVGQLNRLREDYADDELFPLMITKAQQGGEIPLFTRPAAGLGLTEDDIQTLLHELLFADSNGQDLTNAYSQWLAEREKA